jgi:prephenate dehydrogenase
LQRLAERTDRRPGLVHALGGTPVTMAATSTTPAWRWSRTCRRSLEPGRGEVQDAPEPAVGLAGQGLRTLTRIAGSDPTLWAQILAANAGPVPRCCALREDLDAGDHCARRAGPGGPARAAPRAHRPAVLAHWSATATRAGAIPGKHGTAPTAYAVVTALVPGPARAARPLFHDIGEAGINIEELSLEHSPGQPVGMARSRCCPAPAPRWSPRLIARGWHVVA